MSNQKERITIEEMALQIAESTAKRSLDPSTQVGCCLIRHDNTVAATGYNGPPPGVDLDFTTITREEKLRRMVHAEGNALRYCTPGEIKFAAITVTPCNSCLITLRSYGIMKIVYRNMFRLEPEFKSIELAREFGMEVVMIAP